MSTSTLNDFIIKNLLGKGSYGTVYRARRKADGRDYVIKQIEITNLSDREKQDALKEVQILASLNHPKVTRYYDSFLDDGKLNMVMEYCDGGNLSSYIKKLQTAGKRMPEDQIWRYFLQMCVGLQYIHQRRILHRDMKCLNIFLSSDGSLKIGDFGVAKVLGTNTSWGHTIVGTPYYLSPELCESKPYNDKSDVWAAGCILYEMCMLKHPFDAPNQGALILKIIRGKYPPVSSDFCSELRALIELCLRRDSSRRPDVLDILARPAVRSKAAAFSIDLPPNPKVKEPKEQPAVTPRRITKPSVSSSSGSRAGTPSSQGISARSSQGPATKPAVSMSRVRSTKQRAYVAQNAVKAPPPPRPGAVPGLVKGAVLPGRPRSANQSEREANQAPRSKPTVQDISKMAEIEIVKDLPDRVVASSRAATPRQWGRPKSAAAPERAGNAPKEEVRQESPPREPEPRKSPESARVPVRDMLVSYPLPGDDDDGEEDVNVSWRVVDENRADEVGDLSDTVPREELEEDEEESFVVHHVDTSAYEDPNEVAARPQSAKRQQSIEVNRLLDRQVSLKKNVDELRDLCVELITAQKFDLLYKYFKEKVDRVDDEIADDSVFDEITKFVYGHIAIEKVEVVTKIYQLLYLEDELDKVGEEIQCAYGE